MEAKSRSDSGRPSRQWAPACWVLLAALLPWHAPQADPLGRLFTTPLQRKQLDDLRQAAGSAERISIVGDELLPMEVQTPAETGKVLSPLRVKGLVSRKDGINTAWINDSNTFEGDLSSQYLKISPAEISADQVRITMPDNETSVAVKVGQTYQPAEQQVVDLVAPYSKNAAAPVPQPSTAPQDAPEAPAESSRP